MFLSCGDFGGGRKVGGRIVAATMVVGGVLSTGASAAQNCRLCWPDIQCETDRSKYPYVIVWRINCPFVLFLFPVSICMY